MKNSKLIIYSPVGNLCDEDAKKYLTKQSDKIKSKLNLKSNEVYSLPTRRDNYRFYRLELSKDFITLFFVQSQDFLDFNNLEKERQKIINSLGIKNCGNIIAIPTREESSITQIFAAGGDYLFVIQVDVNNLPDDLAEEFCNEIDKNLKKLPLLKKVKTLVLPVRGARVACEFVEI